MTDKAEKTDTAESGMRGLPFMMTLPPHIERAVLRSAEESRAALEASKSEPPAPAPG